MDVGGVSSAAIDAAASDVAATQSATSMAMLSTAMNATHQMVQLLMDSLEAIQPQGVGGSVNTYA